MAANAEGSGGSTEAAAAPVGWQAQKSASTRTQIIESAIKCLVELGYARITTAVIADRAGLSRGAMRTGLRPASASASSAESRRLR